jgi:hypothetical protein
MRPRSLTSMPCSRAHCRIAAVRSRSLPDEAPPLLPPLPRQPAPPPRRPLLAPPPALRAPDLRSVWLGDGDGFPPDVPTVAPGSADYFREVGRARWVIANFMMPAYAPRRGVTYVQTWHGMPLKKIGYDNPATAGRPGSAA